MSVNKIYNIQEWQQIITASTPSATASIIYPKIDGNWYYMNSDGVERIISLSYNLGYGLTSSTSYSPYNYILNLNIDGSSLTFSNSQLRVGYLTSSVFSQLGPSTASYILSVNTTGIPYWIPFSAPGINGNINYISKFGTSTSLTNSNIYDGGTWISMFTSSNSAISPKLFINGGIDATTYYVNSNVTSNINISSNSGINNLLKIQAPSFNIFDPSNFSFVLGTDNSNGNSLSLLSNLIQLTATSSSNLTASVVMPFVKVIGIGTASPTHLLTIFATQSAFRLIDGSQGANKYLVSDSNGVGTWQNLFISGSVSLNFATASGLTVSNYQYSILLAPNSGLTLSTLGISINPSSAGYGLTYSSGSFSVIRNFFNFGNGLTFSGNTYSVNLGINSGLTYSNSSIIVEIGSGLTISNGIIISTSQIQDGITYSFPYYNTSSLFTSSVISQISNNILIGATSNFGYKLYIAGSFSSTGDAFINNINIGRGLGINNLIFGNTNFATNITPGSQSIAIGDNTLSISSGGSGANIAIGFNSLTNLTSGVNNIAIGNNSGESSNSNYSVVIGYNNTNFGNNSVIVGADSGNSGANNVTIGYKSGANSTNSQNVFLGYKAGTSFNGSYSVFIGGYDSSVNASNNIFISDGQGNLRIYSPSSGNVLIGTMSETGSKLVVSGSASFYGYLNIVDGTQASGRVLTSDANGISTWQSLTASGVAYKYASTQSFISSTPNVITHNLNTMFYIIQLFDYLTGDEIMGSYTNRGLTQATITLSSNVSNVGIIIMG
jgi:hypothetical protein